MLVHICHSMSFTETTRDHGEQEALQTDGSWDAKRKETSFSHRLSVVRIKQLTIARQ